MSEYPNMIPPKKRFEIEVEVYHMESSEDVKRLLRLAFSQMSSIGMVDIKRIEEVKDD